ncbi:MAG: hypothetical protein Q8S13_05750, partial [Dehalococcoidia bacterium]|nr:hypothetical protein [Dehalococcoidia bacterium]
MPAVSARISKGLAELAAPYHRNAAKRRAFAAKAERLDRELIAAAPLGSTERLGELLSSFFESSQPLAADTSLVRTDLAAPGGRKKLIVLSRPSESRLAMAGSRSQALVVAEREPIQLKERIELQDRFRQFPSRPLIGREYIQNHSYKNDERGDHLKVILYPKGNPNQSEPDRRLLESPAARGAMVPYGGAGLKGADRAAVLRKYVRDVISTPSNPLRPESVEYIVRTLKDSPETMADAQRYWLRVQQEGEFVKDAPILRLSNEGLERHFRFIPEGRTSPVDARVLDIHRQNDPYGLYLLIEWMSEPTDDGVRVRHISLLKPGELETARAAGDAERLEVATAFEDSLSPNEIKTRK